MKTFLTRYLPWLITVTALYYAFKGIDFSALKHSIFQANKGALALVVIFTTTSYLFRSRRWQYLFEKPTLRYIDSFKVLILGFFMNNILPARTGEFVRAHLGSKVSGETRTLVLASIACERLLDGIMISLFFIFFATQVGDEALSRNLFYVAVAFGVVTGGVGFVLLLRNHLLSVADRVHKKFSSKAADYTRDRFEIFLKGLSPLYTPSNTPILIFWTIVVWMIELCVYWFIGFAFDVPLDLGSCVLFLAAVNFSSLIPAAPGGIGVIEAVTTTVLVSLGIEKEIALAMVLSQHAIQYIVVGIPGIAVMLSMHNTIEDVRAAS